MFRNRTLSVCLLTLLVLAAVPALALVQPEDSPLRSKTFTAPDMYIGSLFLTEEQLASQAKAAPFGGLDTLGVPAGAGLLDPRSGRWGTLMPSTPMVPGVGNSLEAVPGVSIRIAARDAFLGWLSNHADNLGIDMDEVAQPKVTVYRNGELIQIHTQRRVSGVTVRDSFLHAVINHGNLVLFGAIKWGDVNTAPVAIVGAGSALDVVGTHLGELSRSVSWNKNQLVFVPTAVGADPRTVAVGQGYLYRLAWNFWGTSAKGGQWEALVDAHDGSLLSFADRLSYAEDPLAGVGSTREVQGGVLPVTNDGSNPGGIEHTLPTPFTNIEVGGDTLYTNSGGNVLACVDGTIETNLDGPYITINDNCGAVSESTAGAVLDLGTNAGTDCSVPPGASPGNTRSSRSGFYEINRLMENGRSYLPDNAFLQSDVLVNMNINSNCNASSGGSVLNFFTSGGGCSNTGEIAGVFDHEWGHSMDGGDASPGVSSPGEGIADIYAAIRLNDSCIGFNFRPGVGCGGYGDPCVGSPPCSGVRDIDWANRNSGVPHDIAFIDAACGSGGSTPCGGSTHCEGAVYAESVWDLWKRDLPAAPFSMDDLTAQTLVTHLTFEGSGGVTNWYNCVDGAATGDGCNSDGGYLNYLAADDDDGNLTNGTPHMDAIFDAFDRHDIACPTPTVTTAGCTDRPTTAPTLSASPIDRGAELSWTAVADAVEYKLYRTEGVFSCDFGKKLVATTTDLSFNDYELNNGTEYYYTVVAVGGASVSNNSCIGPASTCTTVTPAAGANLAALLNTAAYTINTGDGDNFLDSCELATMTIDVDNVGSGSLTDVRIDSVTSPSHPEVDASISNAGIFAASLAPCATAQASFDFAAVGVAMGDTLVLEINFTADELGGQIRTATVEIGNLESDFQNFPSITFDFEGGDRNGWTTTSGEFDPSTAEGGADGTSWAMNSSSMVNQQCDRVSSPLFIPNAGTTMTMFTSYDIEDESDQWYDRANVSTIDESGTRTVVTPSSGRAYDAPGTDVFTGCNPDEPGWAGSGGDSWASSTFSAAALGSAGLAGQETQLEMVFGTDPLEVGRGFAFDQLTLTDVDVQVEDAQPNCASFDGIFSDGFESGDTSSWSATVN